MTTTIAAAAAVRPGGPSERLLVPWGTVLRLAGVAAFGSGFWLIAVRGAIGAIERSRGPFLVWLLESMLLMPLYVFAVLAALTLVLRWFGQDPLRARAVVATVVLVALACTLVAVVVQATSAVHDYRLQSTHVANMALHMPTCDAICVAERRDAALVLQIHALALNGVVMLVSNLVLLGVAVALRGGRLDVAGTPRGAARTPRFEDVESFLMAALLGAAAIHASGIPDQLGRWPLGGVVLLLLTVAEVDAALIFLLRPRSAHFWATALVSAVPPLVWLYAHTSGLPFGPGAGRASALGLTETAATLLEVLAFAAAILAVRSERWRGARRPEHSLKVGLSGVLAVTVAAVAVGVGLLANESTTRLQQGDHRHHAAAASESPTN